MDNKAEFLPHEEPAPPRTDLWIALVFFVLGVAAAWLAIGMPRFAEQKGEIYTAPGLVPGLYGVVIVLLSIWLGVRAIRQGALHTRGKAAGARAVDLKLALAGGLCLFFPAALLGRMPFWLASAIFVALFTIIFEWGANQPWQLHARRIAEAASIGLATGATVTLIFEKVFYVRLP
jgi:putative tricarboxylic transport membrane protein